MDFKRHSLSTFHHLALLLMAVVGKVSELKKRTSLAFGKNLGILRASWAAVKSIVGPQEL
jgi:hypothetical protein